MSPLPEYPAEPWQLGGSMLLSYFAIPAAELPPELERFSPSGVRPLVVGGHALAGVAFVRYEPGSVLSYDELLVAVLCRSGGRLVSTLPHIWVDSEQSVAGGRALWNIPKGLAAFEFRGGTMSASIDGEEVAQVDSRVGSRVLPGWQAFTLTTAQRLDGTEVVSANAVRAHARRARASWRFEPSGPLGYLSGRRQLFSVQLDRMGISFGVSVRRS